MTSTLTIMRIVLILFLIIAPLPSFAQGGPPLQVNVRVPAKPNGFGAFFQRRIEPGEATVSGRVRNLPGGDTTLVTLRFIYKTNADFALDEIISRIVISIEDSAGNEFSRVTIDPNTVNLNPNRVPLYYSATLYTPPLTSPHERYTVHVRVFGNYE
jgi:hypothetical protein